MIPARFMQENISGNVTAISMDNKKVIPLVMIRYEMIFNYLSEHIEKIIFADRDVVCEPIYRFVKNIPNERKVSWQIFSDERDWSSEKMVIVIWAWNKKEDMIRCRRLQLEKDTGIKFQDNFPCLRAYVHVCDKDEMQTVFAKLALLDNLIASGIHLEDRRKIDLLKVPWNEIEVYRSYDWGQVEGAWNRVKQNVQIETVTEEIGEFLMEMVNGSLYKEDSRLIFDYPYPVEEYIYRVIYGECRGW